jgi:putative SOS response-associated peptidase YedK
MQPIHERMSVIVPPDQPALWLDPRWEDTKKLAKLLRPDPTKDVLAYRVSTLVNNPSATCRTAPRRSGNSAGGCLSL